MVFTKLLEVYPIIKSIGLIQPLREFITIQQPQDYIPHINYENKKTNIRCVLYCNCGIQYNSYSFKSFSNDIRIIFINYETNICIIRGQPT